jgi:hypothetical protein
LIASICASSPVSEAGTTWIASRSACSERARSAAQATACAPPSLPSVAAAIRPTEVGWGGWTTMLEAKRSMARG